MKILMQPEGFISKSHENLKCKIKKSIYIFKQASISWNLGFDQEIESFDVINVRMSQVCRKGVMEA